MFCSSELDIMNLFRVIERRLLIKKIILNLKRRVPILSNSRRNKHAWKKLQSRNYFKFESFITILPMIDRSVRLCESGSLSFGASAMYVRIRMSNKSL